MLSLSIICDPGTHCPTCRNLEGGREWRRQLAETFETTNAPDFDCPRGLAWGEPNQQPSTVEPPCDDSPAHPGSLVKLILSKLGYANTGNCGCASFCRLMNSWGWLGVATTHRREVIDWFKARAAEQNIVADNVWDLIKAAWKGPQ